MIDVSGVSAAATRDVDAGVDIRGRRHSHSRARRRTYDDGIGSTAEHVGAPQQPTMGLRNGPLDDSSTASTGYDGSHAAYPTQPL